MKLKKNKSEPEHILDKSDWWEMIRAMNTVMRHLIRGVPEMDFLLFIQGRTLFYGKFYEIMIPSQYLKEFPWTGHVGIGQRREFSRAQKDLSDREVIKYYFRKFGWKTIVTVRLNMWGILDSAIQVIAKKMAGKDKEKWEIRYKRLRELKSKVEKVFLDHNWRLWKIILPERKKMKLEESIEAGKRKSETSREKRKEKRLGKRLTPEIFKRYLIDLCDEYEESFIDEWTDRDWKSAKNLIQYYETSGKDLRKAMRDVVENWHKFHDAGILGRDGGKPIRFSRVVDFRQYFKYRNEVFAFLVEDKKKEKEKPKYNIIYEDMRNQPPGEAEAALMNMTFDVVSKRKERK